MDAIKLQTTIDRLSELVSVPEEKKQELFTKFSTMSDIEVIKELAQIVYRVLGSDENKYTYSLEVIRNINPDICPPVEEMKVILHKMYSNDIEGNMSMEENHALVNEELVRFTTLFNQYGIDYYIVGALPSFLKAGIPLFRYHDDIDIMINEDDMDKVSEVISLCGYDFHDDRFPTVERFREMEQTKPPHTVLAQNPDNEFHIGFFTFKRETDMSITTRTYSHRLEDDKVIVDVLERQSDPIGTSLRYDEEPLNYNGTSFKTSSLENTYQLKGYTRRPKDLTDMEILDPYIDKDKLEELRRHPEREVKLQSISSISNPTTHL